MSVILRHPTAGHVILNQMPNGNRLRAMRSQNGDHVARVGHKHNTIHSACVRASPARLLELASDRSVQMQLHTRPPVAGGFIYKIERRGGVEQNLASYAPPRLQSSVQTTTNWYKRKKPSPFTSNHISTLVLALSPSPRAEGSSNSLGRPTIFHANKAGLGRPDHLAIPVAALSNVTWPSHPAASLAHVQISLLPSAHHGTTPQPSPQLLKKQV